MSAPPLLRVVALDVLGRTPSGEWRPTVRSVNVTVSPGEVVALIGGSGAGKTTVALAALGYARPGTRIAGGRIELDGGDVLALSRADRRALRGREVAYVAQNAQAALNPALTIGEQVAEPLLVHRLATPAEARRRAIAMMAELDLPNPQDLAGRYPHQASGGQQQRIIAAMAMICRPRLLVLDEPTTALDVTTQIEVLKAIKAAIRDHGTAAFYVSHDLAVVAQVSDRIVVMKDGAVVEDGLTDEIIDRPATPYARQLLAAARRHEVPAELASAATAAVDAPVLEVDAVSCAYRRPSPFRRLSLGDEILHDVSLSLHRREVLAVIGESGSGKSTLARVVAGLHPPLRGEVRLDGRPLSARTGRRSREDLRRVQIIFQSQDLSLNPEQRIAEAIGRPLALYHGLTGVRLAARIAELLEEVGLPADFARRYPAELSGGQRQRVAIARAFAADPDVVLCDEILSALDTVVAGQILDLMRKLRAERDAAYLFVSHDLATVAAFADRIVVLYAGRICEVVAGSAVRQTVHHPYTELLLSSVPALRTGWLEDVRQRLPPTQAQIGGTAPRDAGCAFRTRCPVAIPGLCASTPPPGHRTADGGTVYCHHDCDDLRVSAQRLSIAAAAITG